jgi:hypothetical protein
MRVSFTTAARPRQPNIKTVLGSFILRSTNMQLQDLAQVLQTGIAATAHNGTQHTRLGIQLSPVLITPLGPVTGGTRQLHQYHIQCRF